MKHKLFITITFLISTQTIFGQISHNRIDESSLRAYQDSIYPATIELIKIQKSDRNKLDDLIENDDINNLILWKKSLTVSEQELINRMLSGGSIIGDTVIINEFVSSEYLLQLNYKDGNLGYIAIDIDSKAIMDFKSRYQSIEYFGMFNSNLKCLVDKYKH